MPRVFPCQKSFGLSRIGARCDSNPSQTKAETMPIPSAAVVRAVRLLVVVLLRRLSLQPFLSRHFLNCRYLVRLREVRVAL